MTDMHTKSNVSKAKDFVGIELKLSALTTECLTNIHNYVAIFGGIVYSIQILSGDSIYVKIIHEADGPKRF